ncbi:hypothetical protein jhhlp_004668 [Lomentospora prolificans]|uniref:Zeta toxin domain-containing protein n=1 Tax=Lomentospora prolificans TaxID=41688 RepID=A0A2N3NC88_9PEZI|nr:hypothetical protein jhhlp_004668 [Lomentospora prolificans]
MPPPPDLASYILSESESHKIFISSILPSEFPPTTPLLTNPPTKPCSPSSRPDRQPAHFIADTYKTFHPAYAALAKQDSFVASRAASFDARRWLAMACDEAVSRRVDVLLESACRHPDDFIDLAKTFHRGGYRVEVAVLAVPEGLSRLGILTRFHRRLPEAGSKGLPLRLTPKKIHDVSYAGLIASAEWIDREEGVDQVLVVRRGNLVAFGSERSNGKLEGSVVEAVVRERRRPLSDEERRWAAEDVKFLEDMDIEAAMEGLSEVKALLEPLLVDEARDKFPPLLPLRFLDPADDAVDGFNVMKLGVIR